MAIGCTQAATHFKFLRSGGGLEPTEVRHGKNKLFFAAYVAGDSRPDFRLKLTGTRQHGAGDAQVDGQG